MKQDDLSSYVSELKWIKKSTLDSEVESITLPHLPLAHHFCFIKSKKFYDKLFASQNKDLLSTMGMIIDEKLSVELSQENEWNNSLTQLAWVASTPDVPLAMCQLSKPFYDKKMAGLNFQVDGRQLGETMIHPTVLISQHVFIGERVVIEEGAEVMPGCVLMGNVKIGKGTKLFPNVTIYPNTTIGENCRIHSGTVIGADGFGYHFHKGVHQKIWHFGGVVIDHNVEIGANSNVDGGTFVPTKIGKGSIIDNQVQIAHNTQLGVGVVMCGQSGTGGSVVVGDYTVIGGKAGIAPDTEIGRAVQIAGNAMVAGNLADGSKVGGHPARPLDEWLRGVAFVRNQSLKKK